MRLCQVRNILTCILAVYIDDILIVGKENNIEITKKLIKSQSLKLKI